MLQLYFVHIFSHKEFIDQTGWKRECWLIHDEPVPPPPYPSHQGKERAWPRPRLLSWMQVSSPRLHRCVNKNMLQFHMECKWSSDWWRPWNLQVEYSFILHCRRGSRDKGDISIWKKSKCYTSQKCSSRACFKAQVICISSSNQIFNLNQLQDNFQVCAGAYIILSLFVLSGATCTIA